jgi:acetyl-CoA acetyltransferase
MMNVGVAGIGLTPFGRFPDRSLIDLGASAVRAALVDAEIPPDAIDAAYVANALGGILFGDTAIGQPLLRRVGITGIPVVNVENACTSGSTALWLAWNAVVAGQVETALVIGAEKMCVPQMGLIDSGRSEIDTQLGLVAPASFAMRAMRHMHVFGTTARQMASVVVKSRQAGALNPGALFRRLETIEGVLAAPMIATPLTRSQCCPNADGAAAIVLTARRGGRSIGVDTVVLTSGRYLNDADMARWDTDKRTAALAYEKAGIGATEIQVVECHDAFSIGEILHCEALGLCPEGEGGRLAESGATALGGSIPVNPSGGLLSRGHPIAATSIAQICELVAQLRGEAGPRQVERARVGLAQCMGGDLAGDTKSCTIAILSN